MERHALLVSIAATAVIGVLGIGWGVISGSQMILLDGVYAVIGIVTSWLLLQASTAADEGPTRAFPFGREAFTPLAIAIQGAVLLVTLVYAAAEAVLVIVRGGSDVAGGSGVLYGLIATVASLVVWAWLRRHTGGSDLLAAETTAWRIAALRGVGMVVGFTILVLLTGSAWSGVGPFVDPVMVLITCAVFVPAPVRMVRSTITELLEGAPPEPVRAEVTRAIDLVAAEYDLGPATVRMHKVGRKLYVEVEDRASPNVTIAQEHAVRLHLERRLAALPYDVWLNLALRPRDAAVAEPPPAPRPGVS